MDALTVVIHVAANDIPELHRLQDQMPEHVTIVESRAFDGATVTQAMVAVTVATLPVLQTWLLARAKHRQSTTVSWEGKQLTGYSAEEVVAIIDGIQRSLQASDVSLPAVEHEKNPLQPEGQ